MNHESFAVVLMRCGEQGEWVELRKEAVLLCASSGLVVREKVSNSLLADFPISSVQKIVRLKVDLIAIDTHGNKTALRFLNVADAAQFCAIASSTEWPITDKSLVPNRSDEFTIPNLDDPAVQEFVFKLLFSDEFKDFVADLKKLLGGLSVELDQLAK